MSDKLEDLNLLNADAVLGWSEISKIRPKIANGCISVPSNSLMDYMYPSYVDRSILKEPLLSLRDLGFDGFDAYVFYGDDNDGGASIYTLLRVENTKKLYLSQDYYNSDEVPYGYQDSIVFYPVKMENVVVSRLVTA
jgi:hypothetical protein